MNWIGSGENEDETKINLPEGRGFQKKEEARKKMVYVQWKEKRGRNWSEPFWRKAKSVSEARKFERQWNQFDNPLDKIKLLKTRKKLPKGLKRDKYGTYQ
jgi:hypothetical protein